MPRREFDDEAAAKAASFPQYRKNCMHGALDPYSNLALSEWVKHLCIQLGTIGMALGAMAQRVTLDIFCRQCPVVAAHADAAQNFIAQGVDAFRDKNYAVVHMFCRTALFLHSFRHAGPKFLDDLESFHDGTYPGRSPPVSVIRYVASDVRHCSDVKEMLNFLRERAVRHCLD